MQLLYYDAEGEASGALCTVLYCEETTRQREIQTAYVLKEKDQIVGGSDLGMLKTGCPHERNVCNTIGINSAMVISLSCYIPCKVHFTSTKLIKSCFSIVSVREDLL